MLFSCIWNYIPCLTRSFGQATARILLNVVTRGSLTGSKSSKMSILRLLF